MLRKLMAVLRPVLLCCVLVIGLLPNAFAKRYIWLHPSHEVLLGALDTYVANGKESIAEIAAKTDVPYDDIVAANPGVGPASLPLNQVFVPRAGMALVIPSQVLLPPVAHRGIVINVAEKRLYYFQPQQHRVFIYPVGVGRSDWQTPEGLLHIDEKIKNPVWIVPDSIMKFRQLHGDPVQKIVQSGPDNPLGYFALRLSNHSYLIHGTDEPAGVGRRSSAGCIRMYADDIKQLFSMVKVKTPVRIINLPFKVVRDPYHMRLIVSLHPPFNEQIKAMPDLLQQLQALFHQQHAQALFIINKKGLAQHLAVKTGLPFVPQAEIAAMLQQVL